VYAIGGNPEAARLAGVPNRLMLLTVYTAMGLCCGLASVVTVGRLNAASPSEGQLMELDAIAAVVIGGTSLMGGSGTLVGSLVGVLMIGMLNNGMSLMDVPTYYQWVIKGVVIILAVIIDKKATRST
jgi:ribose/xylose/arabinose/galactoside ABC-type transport system permease subunit